MKPYCSESIKLYIDNEHQTTHSTFQSNEQYVDDNMIMYYLALLNLVNLFQISDEVTIREFSNKLRFEWMRMIH